MKQFLVFFLVIASVNSAQAGIFLRGGMYIETDLVVGVGKTLKAAEVDARKAIPEGYREDKENNSPAIDCMGTKFFSDAKECDGEKVRYIIPLRRG